jgi:hypothetical protein
MLRIFTQGPTITEVAPPRTLRPAARYPEVSVVHELSIWITEQFLGLPATAELARIIAERATVYAREFKLAERVEVREGGRWEPRIYRWVTCGFPDQYRVWSKDVEVWVPDWSDLTIVVVEPASRLDEAVRAV